ncbi:MAG: hypothetical protein HZB41_02285 [Ignavibacteriae bacterium]|nr:hypothetical protein [Ignavibacteriota bacterium]
MSANRFIEQEKIRKSFFLPLGITESKCVYFINGIFGIGKSRFLKRFLNEAVEKKVVDSVFFIDNEVKPRNFYEIFKSANDNFISSDETFEKFTHAESDYNLTRFNEILELLEKKDEGLCEDIRYNSSLISETDYILNDNQANIRIIDEQLLDNYIDKKGDKRLVLDMYRVSIEAFIVDLMNYYFPWENVGDDFERFYFDNEPKKILIAFDKL